MCQPEIGLAGALREMPGHRNGFLFSFYKGKHLYQCILMDKEIIKYVIAQSTTCPLPPVIPRVLELPLDSRKIVALIGIRRSGKTYLLYETMPRLESQGVDRRRILYISFEDDRLLPIETSELDLILRAHEELYPEVTGQKKYLFFDEVQDVPSWKTSVRAAGLIYKTYQSLNLGGTMNGMSTLIRGDGRPCDKSGGVRSQGVKRPPARISARHSSRERSCMISHHWPVWRK
jgi:hypothetical protein